METLAAQKMDLAGMLMAHYKGAQDYQNKYDGYVFNSKFYNKNFGGMIGYGGNWGYSHLS